MGKFKGIGWKSIVNNRMRVKGRTDYKKKTIEINKKKSKKEARVRPITKGANGYPEVLDTIVHEVMHRDHPNMHERTVRRKTKTKIRAMSKRSKKRFYQSV